jgi:hypothetical protein
LKNSPGKIPARKQAEMMNACRRAGYELCFVWAVNGSYTRIALRSRNQAIETSQSARSRPPTTQRQQRQRDNAALGALAEGFAGALGATMGAPRSAPRRPAYQPSPGLGGGTSSGGSVCTPSQKARGWSEERCWNN